MLDTNILIYLIKNKPPSVAERIDSLPANSALCMSFVTYAELLKGAEHSQRKEKVLAQLAQLAQLLRIVPVEYAVDGALCQHYASQFTRLKLAGTPIGANDLWIACHALAIEARLVTHDVREFERIAGLEVEDWV
ncbi:PIN domain-containing protein [Methylomonas koyamae]|uniref:PIN domain-containing protein n=1 Tax=Methylomonas koyamae TaxID=702114 RepID=UPI002872F31D|nr:PIN domain-containing protein [Methylomonas koyamae]WNB74035.1 PIN domain-containing protein [Methylomonas koyamae]